MTRGAAITSVAHFVPPGVCSNAYFESYLETTDDWIRQRTGIEQRRLAPDTATSDLLLPAAQRCLAARGLLPSDVDVIIVATITPDHPCPSTAAVLQHKLGAHGAWGFDLGAACSGFIYGLAVAASLIRSGVARRVLLCAGDRMSTITDFEDRQTAVLFGDAGAAALIEATEPTDDGIVDQELWMNGEGAATLWVPAGGSARPVSVQTVAERGHFLKQDGRAVFKAAVHGMWTVASTLMDRHGLNPSDIDWLVPHQANLRIVEAVGRKLDFTSERVMVNVQRYGNTSGTSIPLCLSEWHEEGRLRLGDRVLLVSFGAGFTSGAVLLRWMAASSSAMRGPE